MKRILSLAVLISILFWPITSFAGGPKRDPFQPPKEMTYQSKFTVEPTTGVFMFNDLGTAVGVGVALSAGPFSDRQELNFRLGVNFIPTELSGSWLGSAGSISVSKEKGCSKHCPPPAPVIPDITIVLPPSPLSPSITVTNLNFMLEHVWKGSALDGVLGLGFDYFTLSGDGAQFSDALGARVAGRGVYHVTNKVEATMEIAQSIGAESDVKTPSGPHEISLDNTAVLFGVGFRF